MRFTDTDPRWKKSSAVPYHGWADVVRIIRTHDRPKKPWIPLYVYTPCLVLITMIYPPVIVHDLNSLLGYAFLRVNRSRKYRVPAAS